MQLSRNEKVLLHSEHLKIMMKLKNEVRKKTSNDTGTREYRNQLLVETRKEL